MLSFVLSQWQQQFHFYTFHTQTSELFFFAVALNFPYFSPQNALGVEFARFMLDVVVALLSTQSPMIFTEHFTLNNFSHEYSDVK
jgi:hypothetical protein